MTILFNNRKLADTFNHRNVVITERGLRNRLGELSFELEFDFGKFGKWSNFTQIPTQGVHTQRITNALKRYQDNIYAEIDALEEIQRWSRGSMNHPFNKVLCQEKPMFFYAVMKKDTICLKVFGEGLFNLNIIWDRSRQTDETCASFQEKIEELRLAMVEHLEHIETISVSLLVSKPVESVQGAGV